MFFGIAVGGIAIGLVAAVHIVPPPPPYEVHSSGYTPVGASFLARTGAGLSQPPPYNPDDPKTLFPIGNPGTRTNAIPHAHLAPGRAWSRVAPQVASRAIPGDGGSRNFSFRPVDRSPPCRGLPGLIGASGRDQHPGRWCNGPTAQYCFLSQVPHASRNETLGIATPFHALSEGLLRQLAGPHPIFPQLAPELPDLGAQVSDAVPVSVRIFAGPAAVSC